MYVGAHIENLLLLYVFGIKKEKKGSNKDDESFLSLFAISWKNNSLGTVHNCTWNKEKKTKKTSQSRIALVYKLFRKLNPSHTQSGVFHFLFFYFYDCIASKCLEYSSEFEQKISLFIIVIIIQYKCGVLVVGLRRENFFGSIGLMTICIKRKWLLNYSNE